MYTSRMGLFWGDPKPRVSKREFEKFVRSALRARNFTHKEIDFVEGLFNGDMNESSERERGVDATELAQQIGWLKAHKSNHSLSLEQINLIDEVMTKYINQS